MNSVPHTKGIHWRSREEEEEEEEEEEDDDGQTRGGCHINPAHLGEAL
jgi:hypothetical protein